jgi:PIN domain nuclease of toxin-antitoxin system
VLVDTHVLLWWLADAAELSTGARNRMASRAATVNVSAASLFEIETKRRLGKLRAPADVVEAVRRSGFRLLDLTATAAAAAGALAWSHRDPFDRLLVAQARELGMVLLTVDAQILAFEPLANSG